MGLQYNGTNIYGIIYNGVSLTQLNFDGVPVWYALTACMISGVTRVGKTWKAATTPSEVQNLCTFQWYRGNTLISGATGATYVTTESDRGYQLKCIAKIGTASAESALSGTILQDVTKLSLSGVLKESYALSAGITPSYATGTYQWYRGSNAISGANKSTYTLTRDDVGNKIKCVFTANGNWSGSVSDITSSNIDYNWIYSSTPIVVANQSSQGGTNDYTMQGKKPVAIETRWWWAGDDGGVYYPTGYHVFTFHYKDGTVLTYNTWTTYRDVNYTETLPSEYQKELDYFDWELITTVGDGIVRTTAQGYPRFDAYYYHN